MSEDRTVLSGDKTVLSTEDKTQLSSGVQSSTLSKGKNFKTFREYTVDKQLHTSGSEADIFVINKSDNSYVLKLYRYGMEPKPELLNKLKEMSDTYPEHIVGIYETGYDEETGRWYEIQEHIKHGSLKDLLQRYSKICKHYI